MRNVRFNFRLFRKETKHPQHALTNLGENSFFKPVIFSLISVNPGVLRGYDLPISITWGVSSANTETFSLQKTVAIYNYCLKLFIHHILFSPTVINCTSLTVDPSGPLRMSSCDNHYGSKCNFSCMIGHRLNGSSTVTCVAPGNQHPGVWNNTIPTCEGKQLAYVTCYKSIYLTQL